MTTALTPITDEELAALASESPLAARAVVWIRQLRHELSDPDEERADFHYTRGSRQAWTSMLATCLRELGYQDTEATRAKWVLEREEAVATLRSFCKEWGDNDWAPDLHLSDVIDKHLRNYIEDAAAENG